MTDAEKIEAVKSRMEDFRQKMTRVALLRKRLAELEDDIRHPSIPTGRSGIRGGISAGAARLVLIKAEVEEQLEIATEQYGRDLTDLYQSLGQLPLQDRIILEQRYIFDASVQEIRAELKISKATYYGRHDSACIAFYDIL